MANRASIIKMPSWCWGAVVAVLGVVVFLVTVLALHFLQPAYDPKNQLMSELALGPFGWAMAVAFSGLALAVFGVQAAISVLGGSRILRVLLNAAAVFFLAAGVFPLGASSEIHIAAISTAFVLSVLAMYLFPSGAGRAVTPSMSGALDKGTDAWTSMGLDKHPFLSYTVSQLDYTSDATGSTMTLRLTLSNFHKGSIDGKIISVTPSPGKETAITWVYNCSLGIDPVVSKYFKCY